MDSKGRILIVDGEASARSALVELLREDGYTVEAAGDDFEAAGKLSELAPHLVLIDLHAAGQEGELDGRQLLGKAQEHDADVAVVVMTTPDAIDGAVTALRAGACGYLLKPINASELSLVVERQLQQQRLRAEAGRLRARLAERYRVENMIGGAAPMQAVFKAVAQVATARASVLLTGEAGTGKELIAAAIHARSPRARGPFIKVHCAPLAEALLDSELFGHERGAFAGATARRDGRCLQSDGGTLFLDEVSEIPPALQVKLLRFLQDQQFERVGGNEPLRVDVRVIAATNRDLRQMIAAGSFREDLYYQLNVINIELPALRDRPSDVPLLAMHFLARYAGASGKTIAGFTDDALDRLGAYSWPGNVRELENVIERAVVLCPGPLIGGAELPPNLQSSRAPLTVQIPGSTLDAIERHAITKTLEATGGSTSRAAEILGISIRKVQYKLHEYQSAPRSDRDPIGAGVKGN